MVRMWSVADYGSIDVALGIHCPGYDSKHMQTSERQVREGHIHTPDGKVWYKKVGDDGNTPLIVLHGGPGYPHDYLESLQDLAAERQVIMYDQLGCGNSDTTTDPALWTLEHFVEELDSVVRHLELERFHILGHSWGSALAVAFALGKPKGLSRLILSDPLISAPLWIKDAKRLIAHLPPDMADALRTHPHDSATYREAMKEYYKCYVVRLDPVPDAFKRAKAKMNPELYAHMWGDEEYEATGLLKDLDLSVRLFEIAVPTLVLCGRYDEATPEACATFQSLLQNGSLAVFEESAHYPFWNERELYMTAVSRFLQDEACQPHQ